MTMSVTSTQLLFALIGMFGAVNVQAGCSPNGCEGFIEELLLDDHQLHVIMAVDIDPITCELDSDKYLTIAVGRPSFSDMNGILLGAMLAARPAFVRLNASGPCEIRYVRLRK